jgi:hypothetical protein
VSSYPDSGSNITACFLGLSIESVVAVDIILLDGCNGILLATETADAEGDKGRCSPEAILFKDFSSSALLARSSSLSSSDSSLLVRSTSELSTLSRELKSVEIVSQHLELQTILLEILLQLCSRRS